MWATVRDRVLRHPRVYAFVVATVVLVAIGAALLWLSNRDSGDETAARDARLVYCLSDEARPLLVDAAVNLGLGASVRGDPEKIAVGNEHLVLDHWRKRDAAAFDRACGALFAADGAGGGGGQGSSSGPWTGLLLALIPTALGAGLTWLVTVWRDAVGIRRQQAEALRSAALRFVQTAEVYLRQRHEMPGDPPDPAVLYERRAELDAQLGQLSAARSRWSAPARLRDMLRGPLGGDLVGQPGVVPAATVEARLQDLREFQEWTQRIALAHSQPGQDRSSALEASQGTGAS